MGQTARLAGPGRISIGPQRMRARKGKQDVGKCARRGEVCEAGCARGGSKGRKRKGEPKGNSPSLHNFAWSGVCFEDLVLRKMAAGS